MKNIFKKEYDEYSKLYQENKNNDYNDDINIEYKKNIKIIAGQLFSL